MSGSNTWIDAWKKAKADNSHLNGLLGFLLVIIVIFLVEVFVKKAKNEGDWKDMEHIEKVIEICEPHGGANWIFEVGRAVRIHSYSNGYVEFGLDHNRLEVEVFLKKYPKRVLSPIVESHLKKALKEVEEMMKKRYWFNRG